MLFKASKKIFLHIDCDSFFASCELLKNPSLQGKYVCVGQEIVIASTYNCKALGVTTGTPIWKAQELLGEKGVFLSLDHAFYEEISQKLFSYLVPYTLSIEPFSIDEAFCEITGLPEHFAMSLGKYIQFLQNDILEKLGIPVTIGCAETRIKAKIYSKINKPFGIYIGLDKKREQKLFEKLDFGKIPFVGRKSQDKLRYKVKSIADFLHLGFWNIKKVLGKSGTDLWLELMGVNTFLPRIHSQVKSISRSRSFNKQKTSDKQFLHQELKKHFERIFEEIVEKNYEVKTISLILRNKEFQVFHFPYHFPAFTYDRKELLKKAQELLEENYTPNMIYRSVGIIFGDLRHILPKQMSIFDLSLKKEEEKLKLYQVISTLNNKIGSHKIGFGNTLLGVPKDTKLYLVK